VNARDARSSIQNSIFIIQHLALVRWPPIVKDLPSRIERLIRPEIRALKAYHVPDASGLVKLDAMENPYSWPEDVRRHWVEVVRKVDLNRYPDPGARGVKSRLRDALKVPAGMELLLGNGSDELIQIICLALATPSATVLAPTPTFVMYQMIATFTGMKFTGVPLAGGFALDEAAMLEAIERHEPAVIFLAYPNNPTGNLFDARSLERVIRAAPGLVVADEAYHAFAQESFLGRLGEFDNLLVMRTLSKQGLAGLRLGILAGAPAWLSEFDKVRLPYNLGSLTQASAEFALTQGALLDAQAAQIRADREALFRELAAIPGIHAWPSRANFILFRAEKKPALDVFQALLAAKVLIKNLDGMIPGCLRVTVGTPEENSAFLAALKRAL
jgi:histidinol-phosphate aminotransferase